MRKEEMDARRLTKYGSWAVATLALLLLASLYTQGRAEDQVKGPAGSEMTEVSTTQPAADPDQSVGGFDIWMTRQAEDGSWSVPMNLGPPVNTHLREISPAVSLDGEFLYFGSGGRPDGEGGTDIYVSRKEGDGWGEPVSLGPAANTMLEELGPCPLPDGKGLLFARRDTRQKSFDLLLTLNIEGEWLEAIGLGRPLATPADESFPSITADGNELFFAARWRQGRGSYDIYQSYRDDRGNWSEPISLGPRINSSGWEYSPGISPDGKRLFFASKRDGNQNWDIYLSEHKEGGTWQEPFPLPPPVNSERFTEYCPSVGPDGKTLYFASDRDRGRVSVFVEEE
jgi:Tol biopolymer transport system component